MELLKKAFLLSCILMMLTFILASCADTAKITIEQYDQVYSGMTYNQVVDIWGNEGEFISEKGDKGSNNYRISYRWNIEDGTTARLRFDGPDLVLSSKSKA